MAKGASFSFASYRTPTFKITVAEDISFSFASYRTPTSMVVALVIAVALAIGHDLFYASLAGTLAPTSTFSVVGFDVSKQQFNLAVGTAFAFMFKAALSVAVTCAYIQIFWRGVKTDKKGMQLIDLDTLFSVTANVLYFARTNVWTHQPLLLSLAIVFWCLPIASVISPATLSVQLTMPSPLPTLLTHVPKLDFTSFNFMGAMPLDDATTGQYCYTTPSLPLTQVASAVSALGQILPITSPSSNGSWSMDFNAPRLQCHDIVGQDAEAIYSNIWDYLNNNTRCLQTFSYLAWLPTEDNFLPFVDNSSVFRTENASVAGSNAFIMTVLPNLKVESAYSGIEAPLRTITTGCEIPEMWHNWTYHMALEEHNSILLLYESSSLLRCDLVNSTYHADFSYTNGAQDIRVSRSPQVDDPVVERLSCVTGPWQSDGNTPHLTAGPAEEADSSCSTLNTKGEQCDFDAEPLRILAYQSLLDTFTSLIQGSIRYTGPIAYDAQTAITETVLFNTEELWFFQEQEDPSYAWGSYASFSGIANVSAGTAYAGLSKSNWSQRRGPLLATIEELFENITLSLMSEDYFLPNYTSQYAPDPSAVMAIGDYQSVYVYSRSTLWIAYSLAIAFSLLAIGAGLMAVLANGRGYNHNFSTVLRFSRTADLSKEITPEEGAAFEPLPSHLEKATVRFRGSQEENEKAGSDRDSTTSVHAEGAQSTRLLLTEEPNAHITSPDLDPAEAQHAYGESQRGRLG